MVFCFVKKKRLSITPLHLPSVLLSLSDDLIHESVSHNQNKAVDRPDKVNLQGKIKTM